MGLQLPANFIRDIQGRDTALVPVVVIGNWGDSQWSQANWDNWIVNSLILSTNDLSLPFDLGADGNIITATALPLLLNIPSLKESIDIEKRNYKISNVNLDISNFPYEGKTFAERIAEHSHIESSAINVECRIFWVSPSTKWYQPVDITEQEDVSISGTASFQIYNGTIRRYTHDDEKVRLVIEDRSQISLHTDLPQTDAGDQVPDKYKNKYIPMVYGHVDRSPLIMHHSISEEISDDEGDITNYLELRLKADTETVDFAATEKFVNIGTITHTTSALYFYDNGTYHNVHKQNTGFDGNTDPSGSLVAPNFEYYDTDIVLDTDSHLGVGGADYENDFSRGHLRIHAVRRFNQIKAELENNYGVGGSDGKLTVDRNQGGIGRLFGTVNCSVGNATGIALTDWTAGYFKCMLEPITVPNQMAVDEDGSILKPITWLLLNADPHHNFFSTDGLSQSTDGNIPTGVPNTFSDGSNIADASEPKTHLGIWSGNMVQLNWGLGGNHSSEHGFAIYNQDGDRLWRGNFIPAAFNNIGDDPLDSQFHGQKVANLWWFDTLTSYDHINIGIPMFRWDLVDDSTANAADERDWGVDTKINEAFIVQEYKVMGVADKEYYASVRGRLRTDHSGHDFSPQAPSVFKDILETELGHTGEIAIPDTATETTGEYSNWTYGFTVADKINSKKLIEELASASPYIPRFDNMGNFRIDTIREDYSLFDVTSTDDNGTGASENHIIKESDVISFSFSRTKIEDVYTKVVLKYRWNYGKKDFDSTHEWQIKGWWFLGGYRNSFYGLSDDDKQQPILTIDDNRGKYIRGGDIAYTAGNLVQWLLLWHCNQHLIMKVRLPLKYMNLEVGDIVQFDEVIGGVKPYGLNYKRMHIEELNGQSIFSHFMITETNKTLEYCEISCIQMHNLTTSYIPPVDSEFSCPTGNYDICGVCEGTETDINNCIYGIFGCMDPTMSNYNELATVDNESCYLLGCIDDTAVNTTEGATQDDGSCLYEGDFGCTDPTADNYNENAILDPQINTEWHHCNWEGCMDSLACNYNEHPSGHDVTMGNGLCDYGYQCEDGSWECIAGDCWFFQYEPVPIEASVFGWFASREIDGVEVLNTEIGIFSLIPDLLHIGMRLDHSPNPEDHFWVSFDPTGNLPPLVRNGLGESNFAIQDHIDFADYGFWKTMHGGAYYAIIRDPNASAWNQDLFLETFFFNWDDYVV